MTTQLDELLDSEPSEWIQALPEYQKKSVETLLSNGMSFDDVAQAWIGASAANTYRFSTIQSIKNESFLENLKKEVRAFLCSDKKYKKEREGLCGKQSIPRSYIIGAIAGALSAHLGVAASFSFPLIGLVLASFGKISINAWCATYSNDES